MNTNSTKAPAKHGDELGYNGKGTGWCVCGERTWKTWAQASIMHITCMAGGHWTINLKSEATK
jgi:hypothetical protein